jgi:hypothetical protein
MDEDGIKQVIKDTIRETVNGKIDRLSVKNDEMSVKIDRYIEQDMQYKDETIAWRKDVENKLCELKPVSEGVHAFKTVRSGAIYFAGFTTAITAIVAGVIAFFKFFIQ